jgi:hypothetical protein
MKIEWIESDSMILQVKRKKKVHIYGRFRGFLSVAIWA